jgi:hypothetical protein
VPCEVLGETAEEPLILTRTADHVGRLGLGGGAGILVTCRFGDGRRRMRDFAEGDLGVSARFADRGFAAFTCTMTNG